MNSWRNRLLLSVAVLCPSTHTMSLLTRKYPLLLVLRNNKWIGQIQPSFEKSDGPVRIKAYSSRWSAVVLIPMMESSLLLLLLLPLAAPLDVYSPSQQVIVAFLGMISVNYASIALWE